MVQYLALTIGQGVLDYSDLPKFRHGFEGATFLLCHPASLEIQCNPLRK